MSNTNEKLQKKADLTSKRKWFIAIGIIMMVGGFLMGNLVGVLISMLGFVVFGFGVVLRVSFKRMVKSETGVKLIQNALEQTFSDVEFDTNGHISEWTVNRCEMAFPFFYERVSGSDLIKLTYKDTRIEASDLRLSGIRIIFEEEENRQREEEVEHFTGTWVSLQTECKLSEDIRLASRRETLTDQVFSRGIKTEYKEFDKHFRIVAENQSDVNTVLKRSVMDALLRLEEKCRVNIYLNFQKDGALHLAVHSNRDLFEIGIVTKEEKLKEQFAAEVGYLQSIFDELCHIKWLLEQGGV